MKRAITENSVFVCVPDVKEFITEIKRNDDDDIE